MLVYRVWDSDLEDAPLFLTVGESSTKLWTFFFFFSDNRTFCQYWEPHIVHNRASGMLRKTQSAICFFPASHKTARLLQPHTLLKTSRVLGEQLPMNPLPYSSSWLRMLLAVPFILNQQITQISGSLSSIDQKILMSLPSPLPPHSILVVRLTSLGVGCF